MEDNRQISLCITSYNRLEPTMRSFAAVVDDPRIKEIVIVDDGSEPDITEKLRSRATAFDKVVFFAARENEGVYRAKKTAISLAYHDNCILLDSDNVIGPDYLDRLYSIPEWNTDVCYLPDFAKPVFDYRHFAGRTITKANAAAMMHERMFDCLINTMNGFYNKWTYWQVWDETAEPLTADSMYMNYLFLKAGYSLQVVPGLEYEHTVHDGSHYKLHSHKNIDFKNKLMADFKLLR